MIFHSDADVCACFFIGLPSGDCITLGMNEVMQPRPTLA